MLINEVSQTFNGKLVYKITFRSILYTINTLYTYYYLLCYFTFDIYIRKIESELPCRYRMLG